jgi:LuxR family maltose regulon positive regulatory protein
MTLVQASARSTSPPLASAPDADAPIWGWAVVEIRTDGTWGSPRVVPAGPVKSAAAAPSARHRQELAPMLEAHVGSLHVLNGKLHEAAAAFRQGTGGRASSPARAECLGRLAHVEALQGDLRRASRVAALVPNPPPGTTSPASDHAQMARTWIALERADFVETRRRLEILARSSCRDQDPWLATSVLLVEARLLMATGQPDAATRLLVGASEVGSPAGESGWLSDLVTIARAEALLASGEPQRSLAALTPMPVQAGAEAAVLAAAGRRGIGDVRGADAVLSRVVADLDREPLGLQIQAWLLEARLAEDRGKHDRARFLLDRALRSATTEQMRWPLIRDWRWLRACVDRDAGLLRSHRDFLSTCQLEDAAPRWRTSQGRSDNLLGAPLTEREGQVLDLLAQMYSTEEIAASLYVSSNTVKTHLKGIFGKLCVNRRVDAVRRGRQLGLC